MSGFKIEGVIKTVLFSLVFITSLIKPQQRSFKDDKGIYLYARMYDDRPDQIQKRLSKRDDLENGFWESSDWIMFSFDSRHDHQTGYLFAINCSGVKADAMIYDDADYDIEYKTFHQFLHVLLVSRESSWH